MTTLTAPQRRALLWLAETPGEWRAANGDPHLRSFSSDLVEFSGTMTCYGWASVARLTPAGIQAAKELAA
ncbi:hypothetical protein [Tanticharoenia sakaeratensis]|uniref:Uncharacterized protein n=1 Tax=Tanticharoenia sakaeratensis NBRC 103193 TaxID=1231623 RepID=A0A0D6MNI2_9PROT|nr:hypothetical protein [Tanticharoenia sakaeratensis]GAN55237.1 hypothetical protein Tasa_041_032 [Tanticharoenia sakaeratensis NBRC 103193]GBQ23323.1 hypothetical protein AA103193_2375 [Tanticharoenia sakaeratensis NBRC 103193]